MKSRRAYVLIFVLVLGGLMVSFLMSASPGAELANMLRQRQNRSQANSLAESAQEQLVGSYLYDSEAATKNGWTQGAATSHLGAKRGLGLSVLSSASVGQASSSWQAVVQPFHQLFVEDFPDDQPRQEWTFGPKSCAGVIADKRLYIGFTGPVSGLVRAGYAWADYDVSFNLAYYGDNGFGVCFHLADNFDGECLMVDPQFTAHNITGAQMQVCEMRRKGEVVLRPEQGKQGIFGAPIASDHPIHRSGNSQAYSITYDWKLSVEGEQATLYNHADNGDYDRIGNPFAVERGHFGGIGFYTQPGCTIGVSNVVVDKRGPNLVQYLARWQP